MRTAQSLYERGYITVCLLLLEPLMLFHGAVCVATHVASDGVCSSRRWLSCIPREVARAHAVESRACTTCTTCVHVQSVYTYVHLSMHLLQYMRTDNPVLSTEAVDLARKCVTRMYGANMLQAVGREREAKKPKGSQVSVRPRMCACVRVCVCV